MNPLYPSQKRTHSRFISLALTLSCLLLTACHGRAIATPDSATSNPHPGADTARTEQGPAPKSLPPNTSRDKMRSSSIQGQAPRLTSMTSQSWELMRKRIEQEPDLACQLSYQQTAAAFKSGPPKVDTGDFPPITLAPYNVFMRDCKKLPVMVQRCQVFQYTVHHYPECIEARHKYDARVQAAALERRRRNQQN